MDTRESKDKPEVPMTQEESYTGNGEVYPVAIILAIHQVMEKVGYVQKKDKNEFHKYSYASEGVLLEAIRPAMIEAGLVIIPSGRAISPIDSHGITNLELEYTLTHISGAVWPDKLVAYGQGGDKNKGGVGDKGTYKALTGANKYMLFKLFQIETGNDPENDGKKDKGADKDKDKGTPPPRKSQPANSKGMPDKNTGPVSASQIKRFHAIKNEYGWTDDAAKKLLKDHGFESTKDIPAWGKYDDIIKDIKKGMDGKGKPTPPAK